MQGTCKCKGKKYLLIDNLPHNHNLFENEFNEVNGLLHKCQFQLGTTVIII